MVTKRTGISRDLLIHPGETIAEVLEERGISQVELAISTGVSTAYVSNVIAGKKDISAKFALALEYALGVPKTFWINLQANYDAELLEENEEETITPAERKAAKALKEVAYYLRKRGKLSAREKKEGFILSLRRALMISNVANVKEMIPANSTWISSTSHVDQYVLGAWIRLCQISGDKGRVNCGFSKENTKELVEELKEVMVRCNNDTSDELSSVFAKYGIDFSVLNSFSGAPVKGYVAPKNEGAYRMVVALGEENTDTFWLSVFHELGHIVNGDVGRRSDFLDDGTDENREKAADLFADNQLISEPDYQVFINNQNLEIESIKSFAKSQNVMPYIVIGRLRRDKRLVSS